ncbi:MAG: hypothetical protein QGI24_08085 [Kiritimatiellia bacterium]|jgi:hypothetical protein|nr:hypothetical protein [Kiritimatiellia bacterium]MDP6848732.1 hypothetical protein [Kiritimatiellia bacterium]
MKRFIILAITLTVSLQSMEFCVGEPKVDKAQKEKLAAILTGLKVKAAKARPQGHTVSLPVASAGARGAEIRTSNRFAVLWPRDSHICPLLAISENVSAAAKKTDDLSSLRGQLRNFIEVYPEYKDEQLLADLDAVLKTSGK